LARGWRVTAALVAFSLLQVLMLRYVAPPFTFRTTFSWLISRVYPPYEGWPVYRWRNYGQISPYLKRAVLASEDQRFLQHHGFDFVEMEKAFRAMAKSDRIRGASTISMQVARTVFLWPDRTLFRKLAEAYYTLLIEWMWPKKRILEIYLNTVDWGDRIMGAEAASRAYFGVGANHVSAVQAAALASILPSPHSWSPKAQTAYFRQRRARILRDMPLMALPR
jgi:monofunctional biosynthetic peptidoglycan transglycosylase